MYTRDRSLCCLNFDSNIQPWFQISDAKFHPDICSLYVPTNLNRIQSIQIDYLPPLISYLWPLIDQGENVWTVEHLIQRDSNLFRFVYKYDLVIWNKYVQIQQSNNLRINGNTVYPKLLILAADWSTCEHAYKHLSNVEKDLLKNFLILTIYEGQNTEKELYENYLKHGCDLLITTPTILADLIDKRLIHFEQLQLIIYDQIDLLVSNDQQQDLFEKLFTHFNLHSTQIQHVFFSRTVTQLIKDFLKKIFSKHIPFLSSSFMETCTYRNCLIYAEPCRNWFERKSIIKQTLDLAEQTKKKIVICSYQTRRLTTMQSILNDLSIQSILIHSQLSTEEIQQYIHEWQMISDRPLILLIQDEILNEITIDNTDIIIHLDVQRLFWYKLYSQRLKLIYKYLIDMENDALPSINQLELTSLKSIEKFYKINSNINIPLIVFLWPGDCAQVTYDFIEYLKTSNSYIHPLIERLAKNNCHESPQTKINVEFCPTLKMFGECLNQKKYKRCPYRHYFHYEVDFIEQKTANMNLNENLLSNSYELYLPNEGEIELCITHVSDGNRLWANILRSRNEINQNLTKIFDYELFFRQIKDAFDQVKNRPLSEIVPGEIYFYEDQTKKIHRVYVHEQEQTYFDIRRTDSILNRLLRITKTNIQNENLHETNTNQNLSVKATTINRPILTVFSLDSGQTFTLKSNENLYPIEPATLKQYPPLATEIILCNIQPLDQITMTFTPFTIETLRSLTLNEIFMGKIRLATRSCFWIEPLVRPVRLAALNRIAYDKPIRKQLILAKLVETNDGHMNKLERLAVETGLQQSVINEKQEKPIENQNKTTITEEKEDEDVVVEDLVPIFKPFVNRNGQMIINPVGRSKEFFSKHNQPLSDDFTEKSNRHVPIGRGHRLTTDLPTCEPSIPRPQTNPIVDVTNSQSSAKSISPFQTIENIQTSNGTTPSEIGANKMIESKEEDEKFEDAVETKQETFDEDDQMMFIFGPKLFSQLRQIKDMEDEQRRQADFPVYRNRNRHGRNNPKPTANQDDHSTSNNNNNNNNEESEYQVPPPNMSRYEPFVGERGPLTQEQIDYKQTQRKTRLFWEQTSRDIYLTIGFYNVDSTQTRVEFQINEIYCRTKIRTYDRFVRIHLAHDILPEKSSFQVRRSNILLSIRKAKEGSMWSTLTNRPIEPRPDFFNVEYGSDDESDTDKRRRTVNRQWEQIREDKRKINRESANDDEKYFLDDIDDDEPANNHFNEKNEEKSDNELTDTSSDCHSTDSDDCYYEDQVPANHIPRGYDEADCDHRFYSQQKKELS